MRRRQETIIGTRYTLHEALDNITPADMYLGRKEEILTQRQITKQKTLAERKAN